MRRLPPYSYRMSWSEEDGECVATCDELPGLSGLAPTPAGALRQLQAAISAWLDYLSAEGLPTPPPNSPETRDG